MPRSAPGLMNGDQIINLVGNYGDVIVLLDGIAHRITRIKKLHDGSYWAHSIDRRGKHWQLALDPHEMWYVTRKDLVGWPTDVD